jgi:hypothetical protein
MDGESAQARRTKKLIRETLLRLMDSLDFVKISMRLLAEETGVNRSTLYRYYGSTLDVLGDCIYHIAGRAEENIPSAEDPDFMNKIWYNVYDSYCDIRENARLFMLLNRFPEKHSATPRHVAILKEHGRNYYHGLVGELSKLKPKCSMDKTYLEVVLGNISGGIVDHWAAGGFTETPEELTDMTLELFNLKFPADYSYVSLQP